MSESGKELPDTGVIADVGGAVAIRSDGEEADQVGDLVVAHSDRWRPEERHSPLRPDLYATIFGQPKGVMRGWFNDAEDLEGDLAKGGYSVVGEPWCADIFAGEIGRTDKDGGRTAPPHVCDIHVRGRERLSRLSQHAAMLIWNKPLTIDEAEQGRDGLRAPFSKGGLLVGASVMRSPLPIGSRTGITLSSRCLKCV
jgi:hypothetical protein